MDTSAPHRFRLVHPDEPSRVVRGRVTWPDRALHGDPPWPFALLLHGFKGFMDWGCFPLIARSLAEHGIAAVAFNCHGSGVGEDFADITDDEAFAKDTCSRQLDDIVRVREYVAHDLAALCDPARGGVFGHSRGGGMALIHAAERGDYRAIVTWAAVPSFDRFDAATKALWRRQGFIWIANMRLGRDHRLDVDALLDAERNGARLDIEAACARIRAPTLLIHGGADDVIEPEAMERLRRALRSEVVAAHLIEGAGHAFGATHPLNASPPELEAVREMTVSWFRQHLPAQRSARTPDAERT